MAATQRELELEANSKESAVLLQHRSSTTADAGCRRRAIWWTAGILGAVSLLLSGAISYRLCALRGSGVSEAVSGMLEEAKGVCGRVEVGIDYAARDHFIAHSNVSSPQSCCSLCEEEPKCARWTWGMAREEPELTDVCFLAKLDKHVGKITNVNVVSGLRPTEPHSPAKMTGKAGVGTTTLGTTTWPSVYRSASMYCFSLAAPTSYETELLQYQHRRNVSIFACDEYAVYSNVELHIAPGVPTTLVDSDLKCEHGGEFGTALNLKIFFAVWTAVIESARFQYHGWTAKVDPDTVFFPHRLRQILAYEPEEKDEGMYINNCKYGLHGPLEVFSRKAVQAWALGSSKCVRHFTTVCSGDCFWGEDMFIDQCLWKVLKVKRINEFSILTEAHCEPPAGWDQCQDDISAAFHPFKTVDGWEGCLQNATQNLTDEMPSDRTTEVM